jgi:hypothetical protein
MSFFDNINPFRKKEDFNFDSGNQGANMDFAQPNLDESHTFESGQFAPHPPQPSQPMPQDDHRMTMPLGENIRQQRTQSMYGGGDEQAPEQRYPSQLQPQHNPLQKELELISSKLDYLKASLDAINQRLVNLEHLSKEEMEKTTTYTPKNRW